MYLQTSPFSLSSLLFVLSHLIFANLGLYCLRIIYDFALRRQNTPNSIAAFPFPQSLKICLQAFAASTAFFWLPVGLAQGHPSFSDLFTAKVFPPIPNRTKASFSHFLNHAPKLSHPCTKAASAIVHHT